MSRARVDDGRREVKVTDPVCGTQVDSRAPATHEGREFYFWSAACSDKFVVDPAKYSRSLGSWSGPDSSNKDPSADVVHLPDAPRDHTERSRSVSDLWHGTGTPQRHPAHWRNSRSSFSVICSFVLTRPQRARRAMWGRQIRRRTAITPVGDSRVLTSRTMREMGRTPASSPDGPNGSC